MSFPAYPEYKDSGVPWLGDVPAHWDVVPLKRQYSVTLGKMLQPDARNEVDVERSYLRAANIKWRQVDLTDVKTMWFSPAEATSLTLRYGDLLVSEGGDVGRSAIWRDELADCHFQNSVNRVRAHGDASTGFLFYWMVTIKAKGYVDVLCNKSTIAHFTAEKVEAVPTPIPSVAEQEAIVAFLDRETAKIDALVAEQERLIALLKEKRQAVISHAVTKGLNPDAPMKDSGIEWLGEIPVHWEVVKIVRLFRASKGKEGQLLTKEYCAEHAGEFPVYSGQTENAGVMGTLDRYEFDAGDQGYLFSTTVGAKAMTVSHIFGKFSLSQNCMIIRPSNPSVDPRFFYYHFQPVFGYHRSLIPDHMQPSFRMEDLYGFAVALPPKDEQVEIAGFLDRTLDGYEGLTNEAQAAITLLQERRAALISAAVTGKIDVRGLVDASSELEAA